jgi:hypothetical protein
VISKGTTHNNGARLAAYMTTGKEGERAELWELRGFEATNIKDAFRDVQIMAGATKCEQPFFHVQVRNRDGETLTRQQWESAADRIERMLGLTGQPRAIAFHIFNDSGYEHMHVAWSRIDEDSLTAKPLPFFKDRLKNLSRELELNFALEPVTNWREGNIKYAPTRAEFEQARRLGMDVHQLRNTIRECWDRSDNGKSFQAALELEGFTLAQGDKRNFLAIDQGGGIHALGKRILDVTAAQLRVRLSDLSYEKLPTVEQARGPLQKPGQEHQRLQPEPAWDRDGGDRAWQDAVINAAIAKEDKERRFVAEGVRGRGTPAEHSQEQPVFEKAATAATRDIRTDNLKGEVAKVWKAWCEIDRAKHEKDLAALDEKGIAFSVATDAKAFAASLDAQGISFAVVTNEEAYRSHRQAEFAKAIGNKAQRLKEDEIVIVTEQRPEYRRAGQIIEPARVHKLDQSLADKFTTALGNRDELKGIDATLKTSDARAQQRTADWEAFSLNRATSPGRPPIEKPFSTATLAKAGSHALDGGLSILASGLSVGEKVVDALFDLLDPPTTAAQRDQAADTARDEREVQAEANIDFEKYTTELAQQRQQQENERDAEWRRQRERGGGRER